MRKLRFSSYSFGCRVNHAEKDEIDRQMIQAGFIYDNQRPDLFVINSCAVTQKAEREVRQLIYKLKSQNPKIKIILIGCAATYWKKNNLYQNLPIYYSFDNTNKKFLVKILKKRLLQQPNGNRSGCPKIDVASQKGLNFDKFLNSGRLLLKIQDGCHRFCSFCIVPYLRGQPKSKKINQIVKEINQTGSKTKEVILTAINTEAFGYDTGESFSNLVSQILKKTKAYRISFGSIHPLTINRNFISLYKKNLNDKRLINFFHIPLQSASDKILQLMKRGYTKKNFLEKITQINKNVPNAFIATDVIVGFWEENDKDFSETYDFLFSYPISKFHVFRFSKRIGTAAYYMAQRLREPDAQTKLKRSKILTELSKKKFQIFLQRQAGLNSSALFLNKRIENYQEALLQNQVPAYIKTEKDLTGEIKNVKIERIKEGKLFGKIV